MVFVILLASMGILLAHVRIQKFKKYRKKRRNSTKDLHCFRKRESASHPSALNWSGQWYKWETARHLFKTVLELSYALISGQLVNRKTRSGQENCPKKVQKMMKIMKIPIFPESSQNEARSISKLSESVAMMI